jgi:hypothetical protein
MDGFIQIQYNEGEKEKKKRKPKLSKVFDIKKSTKPYKKQDKKKCQCQH